jgi:hypothetical protein
MNLIQITEQLKNPAISVPQLMQYANNSNPQVPSYVALAEMQRRQSMQAPTQAPQQTVKDQLGAQLMGLPAAAPQAPAPGAAPQQPPQQPQQTPQQTPQQIPQQPPSGAPQAPMPQPRQAAPSMAGGGLTSIPLNMHHDFAAGGIIAFAGGGDTDLAAQYPEQTTLEQERAERLKNQEIYGFGGDPYAEAKRRYSDLEKRQQEREQNAGSDRFFAGLSALGASGTKYFGEAAAGAAQKMQDMKTSQEATKDANAMKMAELHTLWAKEQEALNRANYAADKGRMDEKRKALMEASNYRLEREKVEATKTSAGASVTSAAASAQNAKTLEEQRKFEQGNYGRDMALKEMVAAAQLAHANKPGEFEQRLKLAKENPDLYARLFGEKTSLTEKDFYEMAAKTPMGSLKPELIPQIAKQMMESRAGTKTAGGTNPYSTKSDAEIKAALGIK